MGYSARVGFRWKRRRRDRSPEVADELDGDNKVERLGLDDIGSATPKLNGQGCPANELHGTPKAPGELHAEIGAHEFLNKATALHELH